VISSAISRWGALGAQSRIETYRLLQFSLRQVLAERYGVAAADAVFREAGRLAGRAFAAHLMGPIESLAEYVRKLQATFLEYRIGVLRIEQADLAAGRFVLTVEEDMDCSGLPELEIEICKYDEGFIAGVLEHATGRAYRVTEVDCWCTGERTCRFVAEAEEPA